MSNPPCFSPFFIKVTTILLVLYTLLVLLIYHKDETDINMVLNRRPSITAYIMWNSEDQQSATVELNAKQAILVQHRRKNRIDRLCRHHKTLDMSPRSWIARYDLKQDILHCPVPLCASTAWTQFLMYMNGDLVDPALPIPLGGSKSIVNVYGQKAITMTKDKGSYMTLDRSDDKQLVSFLFVRDPWIRLLSAYIHSVIESDYSLKWQRPCDYTKYYPQGEKLNMTFVEFINCIIMRSYKKGAHNLDDQWRPQYQFCDVCNSKYTHIGHMETIASDFTHIMRLSRKNKYQYGEMSGIHSKSLSQKAENEAKKYYRTVSRMSVVKLRAIYKHDIDLHGYRHWPPGW